MRGMTRVRWRGVHNHFGKVPFKCLFGVEGVAKGALVFEGLQWSGVTVVTTA